jgi:hypothetical protein
MEELDLIPHGTSGQNFGFPCFEGTLPFDTKATCPTPVAPIAEFAHSGTVCATIGGMFEHDARLPSLDGEFLTADLCGGDLLAGTRTGDTMTFRDLGLHVDQPTSFGRDGLGRLYICSLNGPVYRIDPAQ